MITKEPEIGSEADCVIGVGANSSTAELPSALKNLLRQGCDVRIVLSADGVKETVHAKGHPNLLLNHPTDIVVRKSSFVCGRTLAISADKGAADISRKLIKKLKNSAAELLIAIEKL